nr:MAG: putative capsid protein 3 [Polycipiviridae sp.]
MSSEEEPRQSIEQNDQTIEATRLPEQAKVVRLPMLPTVSITSLIYQWQPMGFRIRVDIPFISDDSGLLFVVRNGPYIPTWYQTKAVTSFVYHWNNCRPIFHHTPAWGNSPSVILGQYPPKINSGIIITQHDMPPVLATLAASFRKWRGDMQYRFRVVAGFATQGYLVTMPFKNCHWPIGIYNEYSSVPPLIRMDRSYREGMINSYVPSDTSMFRHTEITMPYEYPMPWYDQYHWMEQRTEVSGALTEGTKSTKLVIEPCGDNFIGIGVRGSIESQKDKSFIMIEVEYRAMEGFQFADPGVPPHNMMDSMAYMSNNLAEKGEWVKQKKIPDERFISNGIGIIKATDKYQPTLEQKLDELVNPSQHPVIQDHGEQPEHPVVEPTYKECRYDPRTKFTYCITESGEYKSWPGRPNEQQKKYIVKHREHRDTDEASSSSREKEFTY